jgi:cytochrome c oxidase cbb3-type subunit 4
MMDINSFRAIMTVVMFVVFMGIVAWAFSARRKAAFDAAARLPLEDDDEAAGLVRARVRTEDRS